MIPRGFHRYLLVGLLLATSAVYAQQAIRVSMINLLANPEKYDGRTIEVKGFLRLEFEGDALYLHKEDFEQGLMENAVWMDIPNLSGEKRKSVSDRYVSVFGKFEANKHGHMGMFGGTISSITQLDAWPPRSDFDRMSRRRPASQ